jgi:hypothetical protein
MTDYRERACTCHPDEAPRPCPQRYAYSECVLAAEIERLMAALDFMEKRALRKEREIERLTAALRQIVDEADGDDGLTAWDGADIARRALEGK